MSWDSDMGIDIQNGDLPPIPDRSTVYLDIETATAPEILFAGLAAANLATAQEQVAWVLEHAADRALDPFGGRVVCFAICTSNDFEHVHSSIDEFELLKLLNGYLNAYNPRHIVAHFGHGFDFPFLRARALATGLSDLAMQLWSEKPWDDRLIDTTHESWWPRPRGAKKEWKSTLSDIAELLGIVRPPQLGGAETPAAWYQGRAEEVEHHCLDDVRVLRQVARRLAAGRRA